MQVSTTNLNSTEKRNNNNNIIQLNSHINIVKQIDEVTDQMFDYLFPIGNEITPIQRILIEEISKLIGSSSRMAFQKLRQVTGILPSGRTVLGLILDPIGLFNHSLLIEVDDYDLKIIETITKLYEMITEETGIQYNFIQNLTVEEGREIIITLSNKIWQRRSQISHVSSLLLVDLLRKTSRRIEKKQLRTTAAVVSTIEQANDFEILPEFVRESRISRARALLATATKNE